MLYKQKGKGFELFEINILDAKDSELKKISEERALGLSLDEMKQIKGYFKKEGRNPTDIELEAFAQSWSEHCCYKSSKPILKKTILSKSSPICIASDDAAIVEFNDDYAYVFKMESHNHPSALDPYGGAATGIGGILRDVLCMGGQPIALMDPLFFGPLDYPYEKLPEGIKHPSYLFKGVVGGIAAYGNRVGIPTVTGMIEFDEDYVGNCLVNVGCLGIVRKDKVLRSRAGNVGDVYILAGGRTGRDGIHGVTFASAELHGDSEEEDRPAVQLGYAIIKEPLMHAVLEASEAGLLTGLKDFGGGGLSCVAAEMAIAGDKGATVNLDKIHLKEEGLAPWEIWVSESQERMLMTVSPKKVDKVLEIFDFWDVEAAVVGEIDDSKRIKAIYKGMKVLDVDLDFLTEGVCYVRKYKYKPRKYVEKEFELPSLEDSLLKVLNSPRVASKEAVIRRYDHTVRAGTILQPLHGPVNIQTHGDAAVLKPLVGSYKGLALACDVNPQFCKLDPYWGAASSVEENIRNLVSVNAIPHSFVDCMNFGNPEKEDRLADFVKSAEGMHFVSDYLGVPFVSGNVSLYNESHSGPIPPTPTIIGVGIVKDVRKAVSSDLKRKGNALVLVGDTSREMGGSVYYQTLELKAGHVPKVYPEKTKDNMNLILNAMDGGFVLSCHDLSEGGLGVAAAEMAFGGMFGVELDLRGMRKLRTDFKLFSESNGRWLLEVEPDRVDYFNGAIKVGEVIGGHDFVVIDKDVRFGISLKEMREKWETGVVREE
jgi:phosphoribosylformylglycinamidine synthase